MPLRLPVFLHPPLPLLPCISSTMAHHGVHLETVVNNDEKQNDISKVGDTSNGNQGAVSGRTARRIANLTPIFRHLGYKSSQPRPNVIERISNKSNMLDEYKHAKTSTSELSASTLENSEEYPSSSDVDREDKSSLLVVSSGGTLTDKGSKGNNSGEESLKEKEYLDVDYKLALEEHSLPTSFGKYEHPNSKKPKSIKHNPKDGGYRNGNATNKIGSSFEVFDICHSEADSKVLMRYPVVFLDERKALDKEPEVERLCEEPRKILRPGMVLLKSYISDHEQVSIVSKCRKLGVGPGGFYQPGYKDGAKLRLYMMCLGLDWDPQTRKYNKRRRIDRSKPPNIPPEFHRFVDRAMQDSHALIRRDSKVSNAEDILPYMNPDVCIVNFYTETGRLGLHQDRDESRESLTKGLPVVSLSLGDSAEFLYGDARDINKAEKLILESGDVLIFGGQSRHVFHGVASIIPDSAPGFLSEENGLRPGRLNLTFRQNL